MLDLEYHDFPGKQAVLEFKCFFEWLVFGSTKL